MQRFPEKLRTLREKHNMTQRELAKVLGFKDHGFIYKLEMGQRTPNVEHVLKLAQIFGVTPDQLLLDDREIEEDAG